ncbi:serine protease HTRA2-like isoform X1 [Leptotrombidium deliense]|uniref:Serine protease HTRA2, mitochondrial n=1 Tax=Leptotrombidium deliense TaxID=299467 RepID=A0A443SWR9_9ACAR|nr:serine protease HTRA2-like isoform X1 [Leptotrombidium deliense]
MRLHLSAFQLSSFRKRIQTAVFIALNSTQTRALSYVKFNEKHRERQKHFRDKFRWLWGKYSIVGVGGGLLFAAFLNFKKPVCALSKDDNILDNLSPRFKYNFIADVVQKTAHAVVCISVKDLHPFLGTEITVGTASGFLVDSNGLLLTNAHVVGNRKKVVIKLYDGRSVEGVVEFVDNTCDLATIRINEKNLPFLTFGKSSSLKAGEWVIALGSPFSLTNTITAGVVSSSHRQSGDLGLRNNEIEYIQTDAAINIGNSGGPLVNLDAECIGVNTMKVTAGISFAIPSDYVAKFLERAKNAKNVQKSNMAKKYYLGLSMLTLTNYIAEQLQQQKRNFPDVSKGVLIVKVNPGSPSEAAGLQAKDVIVAVDGKQMSTVSEMYKCINNGKKMKLTVLRKNEKIDITVIPQETI